MDLLPPSPAHLVELGRSQINAVSELAKSLLLDPENMTAKMKMATTMALLKSTNRSAYSYLNESTSALQKQATKEATSQRMLEKLTYERDWLLREIERLNKFQGAELKKVQDDEGFDPLQEWRGDVEGGGSMNDDDSDNKTENNKLSDEEVHRKNLTALSELAVRREANIQERERMRDKAKKFQGEVKDKRKFLQDLPKILNKIEKETAPLQRYLGGSTAKTKNDVRSDIKLFQKLCRVRSISALIDISVQRSAFSGLPILSHLDLLASNSIHSNTHD